jgi:2-methylfumaryl-CoA isomerase
VAHDGNDPTGPLTGLVVIDLSTYVAGPSGAMTLAQLGAEVIRIDPLGGATDTGRLPLAPDGSSLYWAGLNKGKRSVEVDLRSEEGREIVYDLLCAPGPDTGILLTNAVGQSWLDPEVLAQRRSDMIVVHISGHADGRPAVDYTVNCEVGLPLITGPADLEAPVNHVLPAWDLLTGLHAATAILAAHRRRHQHGNGAHVTVSLAEVAVATMAHLGFVADVSVNGKGRHREGNYLYGNFGCDVQTADGRRVMLVALTRRHWRELVALTDIAETIATLERSLGVDLGDENARYEYREVIAALVRPWFAQRRFDEVTAALDRSGVLWGPYRSIEELVEAPDSLLWRSDLMADVQHPGSGTYATPRSVLNFDGRREHTALPSPRLGADTAEVLARLTGREREDLDELFERRVIGGPHD